MAFVERLLRVTFVLGEGAFGEDTGANYNTVILSNLRASAKVVKAGGPSMGTLQLQVYGLRLSLMNQLSTLGVMPTLIRRNTVSLEAGDSVNGMAVVFQGTITNAWADFQASPDIPFHVEAHTGLIEAVKPIPPSSFRGSASVVVIMSGLAAQMGLAFENTGVSTVLSSPYFYGSARSQAQACAEAANIEWIIDNGKLAIWPKLQARGGQVPLVSVETGMVGYPAYTSKGIMVRTLFNPAIGYGSKISVKSILTPACGEWIVYSLDHDLDAMVPNGQWFSSMGAARPGLVVVQ